MMRTYPLLEIFFTVFVDQIGFGILIPIIPLLLADPTYPSYLLGSGTSVDTGYILLGFLLGTYPLMQFVAAPILGQLSDRYGRKKVLAVCLFGTCISYVIFSYGILVNNIALLFVGRALDGFTGGNIAVAQASIADITKPDLRARNFGFLAAAFGLGFILGPFIGGTLSNPDILPWFTAVTPFWFAAALSLFNVLLVLVLFPETLAQKNTNFRVTWHKSVHNIITAYRLSRLKNLFLANFFFQGGITFFLTFFSVFLIYKFSFSQDDIGYFFSYVGICVIFAQGVVNRIATRYITELPILRTSLLVTAILMLAFYIPERSWILYVLTPFFAIVHGLSIANIISLISRNAGPQIQGEVLGINASVQALAQSIPPFLSGFIAARLTPATPLVISSAVIFFSWVALLYYQLQNKKKTI